MKAFIVHLKKFIPLLLIGGHWLIALHSITNKSLTSDEGIHLVSGASYWQHNDYRLQPENGNLPQRLASLPLVLSGVEAIRPKGGSWERGNAWDMSYLYLFHGINDTLWYIFLGRVALTTVNAIGLLLAYWLAMRLWGQTGGLLTLVLLCFEPNIMAHSRLMTSDIIFSVTFLATIVLFWHSLQKITPLNICLCGLMYGINCVSKFSAVYVLPILCCYILILSIRKSPLQLKGFNGIFQPIDSKLKRLGILLCSSVAIGAIALGVIWGFFGFRFSGSVVGESHRFGQEESWHELFKEDNTVKKTIFMFREMQLLPEAYLYGFAHVYKFSRERTAFLFGEFKNTGWREYFPLAYMVKSTLPFLLISFIGLVYLLLAINRSRKSNTVFGDFLDKSMPLVPYFLGIIIVATFAITGHLNIGHRHIIPIYYCIAILSGGLILVIKENKRTIAVIIIGVLGAIEVARYFPHYIPYFNPFAGGPRKGINYLADSNLDWGQDLALVDDWLKDNNSEDMPVYLSYFGVDSPLYHGIDARHLISFGTFSLYEDFYPIEPGYYFLSSNMLIGLYTDTTKPFGLLHLKEYFKLSRELMVASGLSNDSQELSNLFDIMPQEEWKEKVSIFRLLRFEILRIHLLSKEPKATLGHSIYVYELEADEIKSMAPGLDYDFPSALHNATIIKN